PWTEAAEQQLEALLAVEAALEVDHRADDVLRPDTQAVVHRGRGLLAGRHTQGSDPKRLVRQYGTERARFSLRARQLCGETERLELFDLGRGLAAQGAIEGRGRSQEAGELFRGSIAGQMPPGPLGPIRREGAVKLRSHLSWRSHSLPLVVVPWCSRSSAARSKAFPLAPPQSFRLLEKTMRLMCQVRGEDGGEDGGLRSLSSRSER